MPYMGLLMIKDNKLRFMLRLLLASMLSYVCYVYFYHAKLWWMLFSTLFVMWTPIGSAFVQGLLRYFLLMSVAILLYNNAIFHAITLGSLVGVVVNTLFFPDRIDVAFQKTVIPFLYVAQDYFASMVEYMVDNPSTNLDQARGRFQEHVRLLPSWVYQTGFDLTLQKGYRYYFMQLHHLAEVLFAMDYLVHYSYEAAWISAIKQPITECVTRVREFVNALATLLDLKKMREGVTDFADDIADMERVEIYKHANQCLELLYTIKEMRIILIQLAKALRG